MKIRELSEEDYDLVVDIWSRAGLPYRPQGRDSRERFGIEVQQDTAVFLGAELDGMLAGVVLGTHDGRKGWINRLAVLPEYRNRGIGELLVDHTERRLNQRGILIVTCLIEGENESSKAFFQKLGYVSHPDITYFSKRRSADW